jgi:hypothetical protein
MPTLTIFLDKEKKTSQVIKMTDKSIMKNENSRKSPQETVNMCNDIAHDVSRNNYSHIEIS